MTVSRRHLSYIIEQLGNWFNNKMFLVHQNPCVVRRDSAGSSRSSLGSIPPPPFFWEYTERLSHRVKIKGRKHAVSKKMLRSQRKKLREKNGGITAVSWRVDCP